MVYRSSVKVEPSGKFQSLIREVKERGEPFWPGGVLRCRRRFSGSGKLGDPSITRRVGNRWEDRTPSIPSDGTYASNIHVQMSCLSVYSGGTSSVLRIVDIACAASSLVIANPKGQILTAVSRSISSIICGDLVVRSVWIVWQRCARQRQHVCVNDCYSTG